MPKIELPSKEISRLFQKEHKTRKEIAKIFNCSITPIIRILRENKATRKDINFCQDCGKNISSLPYQAKVCGECHNKRRKKSLRRYAHGEKFKLTQRKYATSPKGRALQKKIRQGRKKYQRDYARKYQKRDYVRERIREYNREKPEIKRTSTLKKRAIRKELKGSFTTKDYIFVRHRQQNKCVYCGRNLSKNILFDETIDHIVPESKKGRHDKYNIVLTCGSCNSSKRDLNVKTFCKKKGIEIPSLIKELLEEQRKRDFIKSQKELKYYL